MQTQTQVLGQVPRGPQQNVNAAPSGLQNSWQRWHTDQDTNLRRHVVENILQLFKNRKPHVTPEWQLKLPDFVKRLEEALYKDAVSKEEYADLTTLEQRLQSMARRMVCKPQQHTRSVVSFSPLGNMIPTPGGPSNGVLPGGLVDPGVDAQRQQQYSKQQRWLLLLRHASKCAAPEGQCQLTPHCLMARQLWGHLSTCRDNECTFSRCSASRTLLHHHQHCRDYRCPVCGPVHKHVVNEKLHKRQQQFLGFLGNRRSRL